MIKLGRSKADMKRLKALMLSAHFLKIRVQVMDLDHGHKKDLTNNFITGQITFDADAEVTRALDLTLFDPLGKIHLEPDSPHSTSIFIADMIRVTVVIMSPDKSDVFAIPIFTGPIDKVDRDNVILNVKCLGKETLSLTNLWRGKTFKRNQRKTEVIREGLQNLCGETRVAIPDRDARLPSDKKLSRANKPWTVFKALAGSMGLQLFYDGRGVATLRRRPKVSAVTFDDEWLVSEPQAAHDLSKTINAVDVIGGKPKKGKQPVSYRVVAPRHHPLSPWSLGRGNPRVPRYLWKEIKDEGLRTVAECKEVAQDELDIGLMAGVDVKFDGMPHYLLEELDVATVKTENINERFVLKKFTLPLVTGEYASYGYHKRHKARGGRSIRTGPGGKGGRA